MFPKTVSNILAEMVPTETVDEIAEIIHYVMCEEEMKFCPNDEPFTIVIGTFDDENICLRVDKEFIRPENDWRTVLEITTDEVICPPTRDMNLLTCERQAFHVAEHVFAFTNSLAEDYGVTFVEWRRPLSRRHAHPKEAVISVLSGEDTIHPTVQQELTKLFNHDDMAIIRNILPYVQTYISQPQNQIASSGYLTETGKHKNQMLVNQYYTTNRPQIPDDYPFTFSNFLKLMGVKQNRREYFDIQKTNLCNDPHSVIQYREGKKGGRKSEIWYTPLGFFAAFDFSRTDFAKRVRKLKHMFTVLAFENLSYRNIAAIEKDAQIRLKTAEIEEVRTHSERLAIAFSRETETQKRKINIQHRNRPSLR